MSGLKDKAAGGSVFSSQVRKPRGLLTKEERRVIALEKAANQAQLEVENAVAAAVALGARITGLREQAAAAVAAYEKAKAALEAK